jgi:cytochrome P450
MNIDLLSPESFRGGHPHDQYAWLREHAPVYHHPHPDGRGFWAITRHEHVRAIGRDPQRFSSEPTIMIDDPLPGTTHDGEHKMMLMMDPPMHTEYRKLISREFTQGPAEGHRDRFRELSRRIVDGVIDRGACDFVADVAGELPSFVIAELMGLPPDDGRKLYELTEILHTAPDALPPGAQAKAAGEMFAYASGVIAEKRARPADDLASKLLHAEVDGRRLDDVDFQLFFLLLIDAGGDTTRNLLAGGLLALLEHPDVLARVRADLSLVPALRTELLRWVSPVIYMRRTATQDVELEGQTLRAGDRVVLYYGAANRDPAVFERPDEFDLSRSPNPHVAFGGGTHVCLGQHIARVEIDAMLHEVLARLTDIELDGEPEWLPSTFISGPRRMPIRFRAA